MNFVKIATAVIIVFTTTLASAMVRIVPQNNYGKSTDSKLAPFTDRITNLGTLLKKQPMGGAYDIVYSSPNSSDGDTSKVTVLKCPSIRQCSDTEINCLSQEQYWNCEKLYEEA